MTRTLSLLIMAASILPASAHAADLRLLCQGLAGKWQVVDGSASEQDGTWKQDISDGRWQVNQTGDGKCRFLTSAGVPDFDVDTTRGEYDVTNFDQGKSQPLSEYKVISFAGENPQTWSITLEVPHSDTSRHYARMTMIMAGDLLSVLIASADQANADFVPRSMAFHRRAK